MWPASLTSLSRGVLQLLYPGHCLVCDEGIAEDSPQGVSICTHCHAALLKDAHSCCPVCAATVGPYSAVKSGCSACSRYSFRFDAAFRLGEYDSSLRDAILRMKSPAGDSLAEVMGTIFANHHRGTLRSEAVTEIVPIPLHWRHRFVRGHNQAEEMGRGMAGVLGIPCRTNWLKRTKPVMQHEQPSASARWDNIRGAFAITRHASLAGSTVLLVDDVMTTGSTLSEASSLLKAAGARRVVVGVLARR